MAPTVGKTVKVEYRHVSDDTGKSWRMENYLIFLSFRGNLIPLCVYVVI